MIESITKYVPDIRTVHLSTDKQYYQPGENIFIRAILNNDYNYNISCSNSYSRFSHKSMEMNFNGKRVFQRYLAVNNSTISYIYHIPSIYIYI